MPNLSRVLITGGAGFLGSALADRLRSHHNPVLLDSLQHDRTKQTRRAGELGVQLVEADVADAKALADVLQGCRRVVHLASLAGVERISGDPVQTMRTILLGTANLLRACADQPGLERVVIASTSEVYGPDADGVTEDAVAAPLNVGPTRWTYAAAKLAAEHLAMAHFRTDGLPVVVVRPFNVYGPGQMGQGAVKIFVEQALAGEALALHNGGHQVRAWCHVGDLVDGLFACLFAPEAVGGIFNLGNPGAAVSMRILAERVVHLSESASPIVEVERDGPEVVRRVPSIERARRVLDFEPRVDLDTGLKDTLAWHARSGDPGPQRSVP